MSSGTEINIAFGLLRFLGFLIAITMYQAGTAIMARKLGDNSHVTQQRATLNPLPHIELIGTIVFPLITILMHSPVVFGWPKQFTVDARNFKKMRRDLNLVYLSGVAINFIIAILCMVILRVLGGGFLMPTPSIDFSQISMLARLMLGIVGLSNMIIGGLFLLPFPGTAGWNILLNNIAYNKARFLQEKALWISIVALVLIVSGMLSMYFGVFSALFILGSNTVIGF